MQNKIGLSPLDTKRYILDDGINTLAYGNYKIVRVGISTIVAVAECLDKLNYMYARSCISQHFSNAMQFSDMTLLFSKLGV